MVLDDLSGTGRECAGGPSMAGGLVGRLRQHCAARMEDLQADLQALAQPAAAVDATASFDSPMGLPSGPLALE